MQLKQQDRENGAFEVPERKQGSRWSPRNANLPNIGSKIDWKILGNSLPSVIIQAPLTSMNPPVHLKVAAVIGPSLERGKKNATFQCGWLEKQAFGTLLWLPFPEELPNISKGSCDEFREPSFTWVLPPNRTSSFATLRFCSTFSAVEVKILLFSEPGADVERNRKAT